jgi:hypothetical protein
MVSNGDAAHFIIHRFFVKTGNAGRSVEEGKLRMNVKVVELQNEA